jgi:hypothetical protein
MQNNCQLSIVNCQFAKMQNNCQLLIVNCQFAEMQKCGIEKDERYAQTTHTNSRHKQQVRQQQLTIDN